MLARHEGMTDDGGCRRGGGAGGVARWLTLSLAGLALPGCDDARSQGRAEAPDGAGTADVPDAGRPADAADEAGRDVGPADAGDARAEAGPGDAGPWSCEATCRDGAWACPAWPEGWEPEERTWHDGVDNDCDGEVDEFCPVLVHRFDGEDEMDWFGMGVAGAGDVDADGHADWVVSGPMRASGSVFVFSGRDGELLYRWDADEPRDPGAETGWMGISVAAAGDLDADGHGDVLVGGVWDDRPGYAFAFSGADGAALHRFEGESPRDFFGFAVAGVADVNKDDVRDLAIAAPLADPGGLEEAGSVLLFSGRDGVPLRRYDGTHRWEVFGGDVVAPGDLNGDARPELLLRSWEDDPNGPEPTGWVYALSVPGGALLRRFEASNGGSGRGAWLAGAGDVDGDGRPDVVIGEEYGGPGGTATVYSGRDGRLLHRFHGEGTYDLFGWGPTAGCDPNGDGFGDVLVGAPRAGYGAADRGGSVYLFSGADGGALLRLDGEDEDGWLGDRQAAACDADGEGHPQVILGAFGADRGDARQAGAAFVYGFGPCPNG